MTSVLAGLSNALFTAIVHSVWQGVVVALLFAALSKHCRTSQSRYLLSMLLFAVVPVVFVVTVLQSYLNTPDLAASGLHYGDPAPALSIYFAVAWCLGATFVGGRFFLGWVWLHLFILRTATDVPPPIKALFETSKRTLQISNRVVLRASSLVRSPMVTGVLKPVVLLPVSMLSGIPNSALSAVFAHELLHLRRFDHVAVFLQAVGETLLFYHPAVHWLSAEARRAREYRCDDDSVLLLGDKYEYARALVMLEQTRTENTMPALMMHGGDLMDRVERILDTRRGPSRTRMNFGGLLVFIGMAMLTFSLNTGAATDESTVDLDNNSHVLSIRWLPPSITQWSDIIEDAAARHDVPADVLALMLFSESRGNAQAKSRAGARGLMQVMPQTGALIAESRGLSDFDVEQLFDPETNIDFGAWYLAKQLHSFSEHDEAPIALAVSAYNAGPGAVRAYLAGTKPLPDETVRYRDTVLSMLSEKDSESSATIDSYMSELRAKFSIFAAPTEGRLSSSFGSKHGRDRVHRGIDIAAPTGTRIIAPIAGQVVSTGETEGRGKYITIRHVQGVESLYFHLNAIAVSPGAKVEVGDALGEVGNTGVSTGSHLHFEIREFGKSVSPELYGLVAE